MSISLLNSSQNLLFHNSRRVPPVTPPCKPPNDQPRREPGDYVYLHRMNRYEDSLGRPGGRSANKCRPVNLAPGHGVGGNVDVLA